MYYKSNIIYLNVFCVITCNIENTLYTDSNSIKNSAQNNACSVVVFSYSNTRVSSTMCKRDK